MVLMDLEPTLTTVPRMNFLVLLVTVPVSIQPVLPSTRQPPSPPTMRKTILDSLGTPIVSPLWTTEGDMNQTAWHPVLSIPAPTVMTLGFLLQGIQHFWIETGTENAKENVKENVNGDAIVTEIVTSPVLNMAVAPTDGAMHQDHPQNNATMSPAINLTRLLVALIQKTIWMWIGAHLLCALKIAVHVRLSMTGDHLLMTVNRAVCLLMNAIVLIESPLMIVQRDQLLAQSTVLKIVPFALRFHPMILAVQLMKELLAFLLQPMYVHHPLRMLTVRDLLKREYPNNQSLLSKNVSASLGLQEQKTVSTTTNRV